MVITVQNCFTLLRMGGNKNVIAQLINENGKILKEAHEVEFEVVSFFSKL